MTKSKEAPQQPDGGKPKAWFSRRNQTREANDTARARYCAERGRQARRRKAVLRAKAAAARSPAAQLKALDKRLGRGKGAECERARLTAK